MADEFYLFPKLPKELRFKIWNQAMVEARPDRRILVYKTRVVPFKQLRSPLLLVNLESRKCALAFYNVKLDVYAVPPASQDQFEHLDKQKQWRQIPGIERAQDGRIQGYTDEWVESGFGLRRDMNLDSDELGWDTSEEDCMELIMIERDKKRYTVDLEEHWADFVREKICVLGSESVAKAETSGPPTGALYISPEHDVFITDYECGTHFCIESAAKILGADFPNLRETACHHISAQLSADTCRRVSTLVLVRVSPSTGNTRHCVFERDRTVRYDKDLDTLGKWDWHSGRIWGKQIFPSVRARFVLRQDGREPWHSFLEDLKDPDCSKLSERLERWVRLEPYGDRSGNGNVARRVRSKGGYKYTNDPKKADWTRDMMSHWKAEP